MKRDLFKQILSIVLSCLSVGVGVAQDEFPRARPVEPALVADPANDYFARVNQMYKSAAKAKDYKLRDIYYRQAIPLLVDYLKLYPRHKHAEAASYYLAESYFNTGEVRRALSSYRNLVSKYKKGPFVAAASYSLARDAYSKGLFITAAKNFGLTADFSDVQGDKNKARYYQAQALLRAKKPKLAAPVFKVVASAKGMNPFRDSAGLSYGKLALRAGEYEESLLAFEALLTPHQAHEVVADASYHAGLSASGLKKTDLAEKYFTKSMASRTKKWKGQAQTSLMGISFAIKDYKRVVDLVRKGMFEMPAAFKAKQGYYAGHSFYALKDYANAINFFIDVELHDRGSDDAFSAGYYKLLSFYNLGNGGIPEKVSKFLEGYAVNNGRHRYIHQALLMKAETLFAKGKYAKASEAYSAIRTELIDEKYLSSLLFKRGWCLSEVGNFAGSANSLTVFVEKYPDSPRVMEALIMRAEAYAKLENKSNALRDYDHVVKHSKNLEHKAIALQRSGVIQFRDKKYDDMIKRYKELVSDDLKRDAGVLANANYWIGRAYFKQKKYEEGLVYLEDSWKLDKETFKKQIAQLRVIGYFSLKDHKNTERALLLAEEAGLQSKVRLAVYRWMGEHYYNESDFVKASSFLKKGVERGKASATPITLWRYLSKAQMFSKQYEDAFVSVSNLLALEEKPALVVDALLDKSKIQVGLGKDGDAKRTADSALKMNPTGRMKTELIKVVGDFHYRVGEPDKAANYYVVLVESAKGLAFYPQILDRLSQCLEKKGDKEESRRYADMLKRMYPAYKREG